MTAAPTTHPAARRDHAERRDRRRRRGPVLAAAAVAVLSAAAPVGAARYFGSASSSPTAPVVAMAATPKGYGYWLAGSDGSVFGLGSAKRFGSLAGQRLNAPVVTILATRTGGGYYLITRDGGVFTFGDARFRGSLGATPIASAIVDAALSKSGAGYWLAAADGSVYSFGDAVDHGSALAAGLNAPVVSMARTGSGNGYYLVTRKGRVLTFGDAVFRGPYRSVPSSSPVVAIARTRHGYWLASADGEVRHFGEAPALASPASANATLFSSIAAISTAPRGGYWVAARDGTVFAATTGGALVTDPRTSGTDQKIAADLLSRINTERRARNLPELVWDTQLATLAADWADRMADTGQFVHRNLQALFSDPTYAQRYQSLRENIYYGWGSYHSSGQAHWGLMNSDHHRATILDPNLTSVGVGAVCRDGTLWVTQNFGTWKGLPVPQGRVPTLQPIIAADRNGVSC